MLEVAARPGQLRVAAIAPDAIAAAIAAHPECSNFTVLMSGDTGFFSGTKKLLPLLPNCHVRVLPGLSSMSYLCARLGKRYEEAVPVSLHGREHDIAADVRAQETVFALVGGEGRHGEALRAARGCGPWRGARQCRRAAELPGREDHLRDGGRAGIAGI